MNHNQIENNIQQLLYVITSKGYTNEFALSYALASAFTHLTQAQVDEIMASTEALDATR